MTIPVHLWWLMGVYIADQVGKARIIQGFSIVIANPSTVYKYNLEKIWSPKNDDDDVITLGTGHPDLILENFVQITSIG